MSAQFKGVQAHIRSKFPKELYVYWTLYSFNLAMSTASIIKLIRNCLRIIEKLHTFFNTSKRKGTFLLDIENSNIDPKALKRLCVTLGTTTWDDSWFYWTFWVHSRYFRSALL